MTVVRDDEGLAVILALLITALLAGLGVTLLLVSDAERRFSANSRSDQALRYAADAGLGRAIADLEAMADWSAILAGGRVTPRRWARRLRIVLFARSFANTRQRLF